MDFWKLNVFVNIVLYMKMINSIIISCVGVYRYLLGNSIVNIICIKLFDDWLFVYVCDVWCLYLFC